MKTSRTAVTDLKLQGFDTDWKDGDKTESRIVEDLWVSQNGGCG